MDSRSEASLWSHDSCKADHARAQGGRAALQELPHVSRAAWCGRRALVAGDVFPRLGPHVAHFLATTLFKTSLFAQDTRTWR